jgi:hypothetical protein
MALKPTTEVPISPHLKVKVKAQVLQGKANILFVNPYVNWTAQLSAGHGLKVHIDKELRELGVKTEIDYHGKNGAWEASINKTLTPLLSGKVSSTQQTRNMAFTKESDKKIQLNFQKGF